MNSTALVSDESLSGLNPRVVLALRRWIKTTRPSVVYANGGATLRYAVAATRLMRRRPQLIYGSIGEPSFWIRGPFHRLLQRILVAACRHVTAVSAATASDLLEVLKLPADKVTVVRPGVDDRWFRLERSRPVDDRIRVLFAGSLSFEKDPRTAVEVLSHLEKAATMRVAGEGPLRKSLERVATENVRFVGSVEDLAPELERADVLLLTSLTEGLPGVAVEASAAAVPIVASDVGGVREIVDHDQSGYVVDPGDVDGFVSALLELTDSTKRRKFGEAARERAAARFRLGDSIQAYEDLFERIGRP